MREGTPEDQERVEALARILHESGREAVERNLIYRNDLPIKPFCEWHGLPAEAREGRRLMAAFLMKNHEQVIALVTPVRVSERT